MRGLFVVFDGIDGCGKSTQLALAAERMKKKRRSVMVTREPGGTAISEKIRSLVLSSGHGEMVDECELLLYAAARAQHVREKIVPALERGAIVLCDRFDVSTYAYQGFGRKVPLSLIEKVNGIAAAGVRPDITFIFDISVETAFARLSAMDKSRDRLESGGRDFFARVAAGFRSMALQHPEKITLLDATLPVEDLGEQVYRKIMEATEVQSEK
ncbi:MAG: dTMP kinase [Chitinispirillaceae bacterium]|nr:dTMP kinase [Chitinispirillaceae bacterium]